MSRPISSCEPLPMVENEEKRDSRREEELVLIENAKAGDLDSFQKLVLIHIPFVCKISCEFKNQVLALEDIIGEGLIGLMEAITRYDPGRNCKFVTYAVWWIRRTIIEALSMKSRNVRIPRYRWKMIKDVYESIRFLQNVYNRVPTRNEIAVYMGVRIERIESLIAEGMEEVSFDAPIDEEGNKTYSYYHEFSPPTQEKDFLKNETLEVLKRSVGRLSEREKRVITGRFGLDGKAPMTLKELAGELRVTKERVRQIEILAKNKLKSILDYNLNPHN